MNGLQGELGVFAIVILFSDGLLQILDRQEQFPRPQGNTYETDK